MSFAAAWPSTGIGAIRFTKRQRKAKPLKNRHTPRSSKLGDFQIRQATEEDLSTIVSFIRRLAEYERLAHEAVMTEEILRETLFGPRPFAEVLLGYHQDEPVAFAVYFHNFSTFLGRPG